LKKLLIPVPSLAFQRSIADRVDGAVNEIDRMITEASVARRLLDRLDQAILSKAFRGDLVPQDPADEPSSILLERIKSERTGAAACARRGHKPKVA
jgi:type I restriction enzyme S subunit